jgi:thiosulfate/3-mercaptopyruvate sulfurtransferase
MCVKKLLLVLTVIGLVFVGCGKVEQKAQYNYIDANKTAELMREDISKLVLVDIQERDDFTEEHLKGAKHKR